MKENLYDTKNISKAYEYCLSVVLCFVGDNYVNTRAFRSINVINERNVGSKE